MNELGAESRHLTDVAVAAATLVADDLLHAFRSPMMVDVKRDDHDPVTVHDRRAEERIAEHLLGALPDSMMIGEEHGVRGAVQDGPRAGQVAWHVDPIDGTANFCHGVAFFATSIGAVLDGQVVAGAICAPALGQVFSADIDAAYVDGQRLRSRGARQESAALMITGYPSARETGDLTAYGRLLAGYQTVRRTGSAALGLAHVAAGWADAALGTTVHSWDVCAGLLLVERAGGRYRPLRLGTQDGPPWTAPGYLATVPTLTATIADDVADGLERAATASPDEERTA